MIAIDGALGLWFGLTLPSVLFAAYDLSRRTPAMTVMKWGWVLVILYTGPIGLFVYLVSCREPLAGTHPEYVAPLWKQAVGSTIHCVAGDATGIIAGALLAVVLHVSSGLELMIEYALGFSFGLLIFQALFMKLMGGGGYFQAVRRTVLPEWLSMNALMAAMIPVMVTLMSRVAAATEPSNLRFWGVMSLAVLIGSLAAYPVNLWLVARGLKHGMGTVQVLGRGGHRAAVEEERTGRRESAASTGGRSAAGFLEVAAVSVATLAALAAGVWVAARFGGLAL